jgi:hypothetical protein
MTRLCIYSPVLFTVRPDLDQSAGGTRQPPLPPPGLSSLATYRITNDGRKGRKGEKEERKKKDKRKKGKDKAPLLLLLLLSGVFVPCLLLVPFLVPLRNLILLLLLMISALFHLPSQLRRLERAQDRPGAPLIREQVPDLEAVLPSASISSHLCPQGFLLQLPPRTVFEKVLPGLHLAWAQHFAVSRFFVHLRYCPVRQCPVFSW